MSEAMQFLPFIIAGLAGASLTSLSLRLARRNNALAEHLRARDKVLRELTREVERIQRDRLKPQPPPVDPTMDRHRAFTD